MKAFGANDRAVSKLSGGEDSDEVSRLRRTVRDLVALSSLPSIWVDCDLDRSLQNLADVLRATLRARTVCIRLERPDGSRFESASSERLSQGGPRTVHVAELLEEVPPDSCELISLPTFNGSGPMNLLPHPVFAQGRQVGTLVACYREDFFPEENERMILQVAANQITLLLQRHHDQEERLARKLAEDRLRRAEHHYQQLVQSLPAAVYTCDNEGRITLYNEAAVALWGRRPRLGEDLWCGSWKIFRSNGQPLPLAECPMAVALREGRSVRGQEIIVERPDGTRSFVLPHPDPIRDESGAIVGTVNMLVEVDELKRAEQALRSSEGRLQSLLQLMPAAVYACDGEGRITFYNRRAAELWGREPALNDDHQRFCAAYRCWFDGKVLAPEDTPMAIAVREGTSFRNLEPTFERRDGVRVPVLVNIDPILDADGKSVGAINVFQDITPLKRVEAELRRKNNQLAAFLDTAALGLHRVGPDGIIQWANTAEMRMLGYAPEEYIGHHIAEFHADQAVIDDILQRLSRGEMLCEREARLRGKDGSIKYVLIDSSVLWEEGQFVHTQCFTRDITAHKRDQEALRRTAEFDEAVMHGMGEGLYTLDDEGRVTSINPAAEKLFGWTFEELRGRKMHDVTHCRRPDGTPFPAEECPVLRVLCEGKTLTNHEDAFIRKDGTFFDVVFSSAPLREDDRVVGLVVIFRDVTERKRAEENTSRLAAIVEHSDDAIFSTDLTGIIKSWNRGAQKLYLYAAEEVLGRSVMILVPAERQHEEGGILERIRQGEAIENYETLRRRKDGHLLDVSLTVSPVKDANGKIVGASKVARDITDKVRATEKLEQIVAERTASLQQAVAQMEEFSYSVSHDLRAPVRTIEGYTRVLNQDCRSLLPADAQNYLDKITRSTARMNRLINDVLTLSRVAQNEIYLHHVALRPLIEDVIEQYPEMQPPRTTIEFGELHAVVADDVSLSQAVSNLLSNAVKFIAAGTQPRVKIWSEPRGDVVRLWIEDNGIGIKPELHSKLFGMFQRLLPNGGYDGTGIGLAIVRKAVERMGGAVGMESDGKNGSRFWIDLKGCCEKDAGACDVAVAESKTPWSSGRALKP